MKKVSLSIPKPCHENWEAMSPEAKGRFCGSCQKTVVDFSNMNDSQIAQFFKKPAGPVCGRFHPDQLEREMIVPRKRLPWIKYFFQFTWPAAVLLLKSCGQREAVAGKIAVNKPLVQKQAEDIPVATVGMILPQITPVDTTKKIEVKPPEIEDFLVGEIALPETVKGDTIVCQKLTEPDTLIKPFVPAEKFIRMGRVSIAPPKPVADTAKRKAVVQELKTDSAASVPFTYTPVVIDDPVDNNSSSAANALTGTLGMVSTSFISNQSTKAIRRDLSDQTKKSELQVLLYPNPIVANSNVIVKLAGQNEDLYQISVFNSKGQLCRSEQQQSVNKQVSLKLGNLTSGTYFVRLVSSKTGEQASAPLVVQ